MWRDWKYLIAYIAPLAAFAGIYAGGIWSPGSIYVGFVLIPLLEQVLPQSTQNVPETEEALRSKSKFFDVLLYLNVPLLYGLLAYFFYTLLSRDLSASESVWMTLNVGLVVGIIGINVAHELGHRTNLFDQRISQFLLLSALYMHFFIEHNRGHHKHVATEADPATARYGESIYGFWLRSTVGAYINAWKLETSRLQQAGKPAFHHTNQMLQFQLIQLAYLLSIGIFLGWQLAAYAVGVAVVGFLLLESVNYIEHYGLLRKRLPSGRYEPVQPWHSWNSDHELGRIFLYELTRHSDHHYKATRKYQVLRHFDESPQLKLGYPGSILLALLPPLWFRFMNPRVRLFSHLTTE